MSDAMNQPIRKIRKIRTNPTIRAIAAKNIENALASVYNANPRRWPPISDAGPSVAPRLRFQKA